MTRRALAPLLLLVLLALAPGGQTPSGTLTITPDGPYTVEQTITLSTTISGISGSSSWEVNITAQCNGPLGQTLIPAQPEAGWYPQGVPAYEQEAIALGGPLPTKHFVLPDNGGAGGCQFHYAAIKHNKQGGIVASYVLDTDSVVYG